MVEPSRRHFLRGLGGALLAAPFLGSVFARSAKAAASVPPRMILMFTHYGHITNKWFPLKLDGELTAEDLQPTTLAPLAPFAKKLLLPRGMRTMNEWTEKNTGAGHGRGQGNDVRTQVCGSLLTCQPVTPNSNQPFDFDSVLFTEKPIGPSLDHVMAQQLSPLGTPLLMNTAGQIQEASTSAISYSAAETLYRAVNAANAFSQLTGLFDSNAGMNADSWAVAKGKALADIVKDDLDRLRRQDMSRDDQRKLDAWTELVNQVGTIVAAAQCSQENAMRLGASNKPGTGTGDALTRKVSDTMDNADLYSAIAALSVSCNANPVVVLKYPANFTFSGLGINADSGNQSGRLDSAAMIGTCVPGVLDNLLKIDAYYAQKFAKLLSLLDGMAEGDGSLLDNTVTLWMSEYSDGLAHNLNNATVIQAGSAGGYFKTGRVVHLDPASGATPEQMLGRSTAQCGEGSDMKVDALSQSTGTDAQLGNAPINKYYCSLMNALRMKADAMGFPAKDGPNNQVTHFGYSDKTEDFCGGQGAVEGAGIHDPGPFDALKA